MFLPVVQVIASYASVRLITLTQSQAGFASPAEAYAAMTLKVSRLMQVLKRGGYLHSGRYFAVLEVHKTGWPHWHVIVDAPDIPHEVITRVWANLGGGFVWISRGPSGKAFQNAKHAAHYALKYLRKEPAKGWPDWILDSDLKIRRFRTSQGFFEGGKKRKSPEEKPAAEEEGEGLSRKLTVRRSHRIRIMACGSKTLVMGIVYERRVCGEFRETRERRTYLGEIPLPRCEVLREMGCDPDHEGRFEAPMSMLRDGPAASLWSRLPWTGGHFDQDASEENARRKLVEELCLALR